jgi:hypothetical protein
MAPDITHSVLALAIGITSSTTFLAMNSTINYIAFPSYYLRKVQASTTSAPESSPALLLRQWALTFRNGHAIGPTTTILSTIAFIYAARTAPADLQPLLYVATASAAAGFPFTVAFILPVYNELYRRVDALEKTREKEEQEKIAGGDTLTIIANCLWLSKIRAVLPVPAISIGIYAIWAMVK